MTKRSCMFTAVVAAVALLIVGAVNALGSSNASDVNDPVSTPRANLIEYHVVGDSMAPTIQDGDWLQAKTNFKFVSRGDIIILRYPKDPSKIYCRRVVAVAGDHVVMQYFPNVKLTTAYNAAHPKGIVFPVNVMPEGNAFGVYPAEVTPGYVYVVGDNTAPGASFDSDQWGLLPVSNIIAVVTNRLSPSPREFM